MEQISVEPCSKSIVISKPELNSLCCGGIDIKVRIPHAIFIIVLYLARISAVWRRTQCARKVNCAGNKIIVYFPCISIGHSTLRGLDRSFLACQMIIEKPICIRIPKGSDHKPIFQIPLIFGLGHHGCFIGFLQEWKFIDQQTLSAYPMEMRVSLRIN